MFRDGKAAYSDRKEKSMGQITAVQTIGISILSVLLLIFLGLAVYASLAEPTVQTALLPFCTDTLRTVVGALVGAGATMLGSRGK